MVQIGKKHIFSVLQKLCINIYKYIQEDTFKSMPNTYPNYN